MSWSVGKCSVVTRVCEMSVSETCKCLWNRTLSKTCLAVYQIESLSYCQNPNQIEHHDSYIKSHFRNDHSLSNKNSKRSNENNHVQYLSNLLPPCDITLDKINTNIFSIILLLSPRFIRTETKSSNKLLLIMKILKFII